jgi:sialate O-acetylesterase
MAPEMPISVVADVFGENMVLQRGKPVPVWGVASAEACVTVSFAGQTQEATADKQGRWRVVLDPMPASSDPRDMVVTSEPDGSSETLGNVLVGEVWLCSGQSNMETSLSHSENGALEVAGADHPLIRFLDVPHTSLAEPTNTVRAAWQVCSPETAGSCFAVSYYMARHLQDQENIPVGLLNSAWSGACGETWIPLESMKEHPTLRACVDEWEAYRRDYPERQKAYQEAKAAGRKARRVKHPEGPEMSVGMLYNGMLHPMIPYAVRGVAWYQGENNVLNTERYKTIFPFLIREWRRLWDASPADLPFLFVQIANFGKKQTEPEDSIWPRLREAQCSGLGEPHTAMVTAIDIGGSFHPKNKRDVGIRLALAARATVYGEDGLVWCGPTLASADFDGNVATLTFDHTGTGLAVRDDGELEGFAVAGDDGVFVWGSAAIVDEQTVSVTRDDGNAVVAVRYAWGTNPRGNLVNGDGFPAFPFRTDDWSLPAVD